MNDRLNFIPCGYVSISQTGMVTEVNHTFLEWMGYTEEDLVQRHFESIMSPANKLIFHTHFYPYIRLNGHVEELFLSLKDSTGQLIPFILNGRRFEIDGVEVIDCILVQMGKRIDYERELWAAKNQIEKAYLEQEQALAKLKNIHMEIEKKQAELVEYNATLKELSVTDKLTGLKNRRFFQERLEGCIARHSKTGQLFSVLIIDIDHFKKVNDTFGHQAGDDVLKQLADTLTEHSHDKDTIARLGGEEFVIILPGTDAHTAKSKAEALRFVVEHAEWRIVHITVSIGVATMTLEDSDLTLLNKADQALYVSKENGRNRVTHYEDISNLHPQLYMLDK
ncbi:sensor domain-containing diguanylate cyclase [Paenibacillus dakarensis]|uniref:sensor domain-containing diguanylate cyclase n=1 Tax=Paenibacillus dakarensis TaxID=1527293 RepID=UPI0006D58C7B|nr:sensor domain-containing diguanylate cyclase [Paenibacillus dakarensis]